MAHRKTFKRKKASKKKKFNLLDREEPKSPKDFGGQLPLRAVLKAKKKKKKRKKA